MSMMADVGALPSHGVRLRFTSLASETLTSLFRQVNLLRDDDSLLRQIFFGILR